ncbi:hypothetical protein ACHAXT_005602 [Thalassiosira profunda]
MHATARNCKDASLLEIVARSGVEQEGDPSWDDVLAWFDATGLHEAREATVETNDRGETALHVMLRNNGAPRQQLLDVVRRFRDVESDAFRMQDAHRGNLPLHYACQGASCEFDVVEELIRAYPAGLSVMNSDKYTPFGWDYNISLGRHFTQFLQHVVATDLCESGAKGATLKLRKDRHRLLRHCKNYVPLEILRRGMLDEQTLESSAMIRFLNEMPCKRTVVGSMVFELYLHIAWIVTFIHATTLHIENDLQLTGWEPIALLVFAALFFLQEFYQMYRFYKTNAGIAYWMDLWNWIDLTTASLVTASAIQFLQNDESRDNDRVLITTGCFQFVLLISYLKKTFFPFSKFVSGVIKIFWCLVPFFVVSVLTLFAFSFMYYSFKTTYTPFASGPEGNENILDFLFGLMIIIVLLNVVIAVVTEAWEDASEEANAAFWSYRLDLILEKTRGVDDGRFSRTPIFRGIEGLDNIFVNYDTVGTTPDEIKHRLSIIHREDGSMALLLLIARSLGLIVLGFPTFGVLWPKFFRQILFTPPKPKEDEAKVQLDVLAEEMAECKQLSKEREAGYARMQKDIKQLSDRMNVQLETMQQLLGDRREAMQGDLK